MNISSLNTNEENSLEIDKSNMSVSIHTDDSEFVKKNQEKEMSSNIFLHINPVLPDFSNHHPVSNESLNFANIDSTSNTNISTFNFLNKAGRTDLNDLDEYRKL